MSRLYSRFLRSLVLPLGDFCRGVPMGEALRLLDETQWWPAERLTELRDRKLRQLIATAYENVPYYRQMMTDRGIRPEDIQTADDLPKLPLLTKEIFRQQGVSGMTHQGMPVRTLLRAQTGGSTGEPLFFYLSKGTRAYDRASFYRFLRWCGSDRGELAYAVWGQRVVKQAFWRRLQYQLKLRWITHHRVLNAYEMTPEAMSRFMRSMRRERPDILRGYSSAMTELARFVESEGVEVPPLKALTTTAEQILPTQRAILERVFKAPLFDQYGCGETGGVSYECPHHKGLHIALEHCVVEIVDEQGDRVPPGQHGRIVLTNLDNDAMPFIRYVNGDEASLLAEPCPCGRQLPLMSPVTGRTRDMIIGPNGNRVHGGFFTRVLMDLNWTEKLRVREFQVIQTDAGRLEFNMATERPPADEDLAAMSHSIRKHLGDMRITYNQVDRVDRGRSGKLRYTIREWEPGEA